MMPSRGIHFKYRDRLGKIVRKLKALHLPASLPSESYLVDLTSSESTPPAPRDPNKPRGSLDEDEEPADEIIVDSLLLPAAVSTTGSRRQSSMASSVKEAPVQEDNYDTDPGWSEISQSSTRAVRTWFVRTMRFGMWPKIKNYFDLSFDDESVERHYQKENWYMRKPLALMAALFILLSWILALGLIPRPWNTYDMYSYIGIVGFFSLLIPILVVFDVPRYRYASWQIFLLFTCWSWPVVFAVEMKLCDFFDIDKTGGLGGGACGNKDFFTTLYYAAAYPVLALFALRQTRLWAMIGSLGYCVCLGVTIVPDRASWVRNLLVYFTFMIFINIMSHSQERIDRRMFLIRDQLKFQYRATQRAQHLEHKAADSKKRFVSYIFHEVRVPLNSALLAIQNLAGEGVFKSCDKDQREMVDALTGSLGMMAKVLNDVLDFNRMEDGKLACTHNPFDFHKVVRSIFVSARAVAENRGVNLVTELDERIDKLCESKVVIGDEMRLRQVLSNLTSNACKFTNSGGTVKILTRLLYPTEGGHLSVPTDTHKSPSIRDDGESVQSHRIDIEDLDPINNPNVTIIRMEVHDTGVGIRRCELIDNRLFSPYVQTEEGRRQGGKGTGLGLALVRHIVKLSGGRLGVQSRLGVGSVFWVELPLGLQDRSTPVEELSCFIPTLVPPNFGGTTESVDDPEMSSASKPDSKSWKKVRVIVDKEERLEPYLPALAGMGSISEGEGIDIKQPYSDDSGKEIETNGTSYRGKTSSNIHEEVRVPVNGEDVVVVITGSEETEKGIELERIRRVDEPPIPEPSSATIDTKASPPATAEPRDPEKPEETRKLNLLVVDDDRITRRLMSRLLSRLGHKVETAEDGSIALKKLTSSFEEGGGPPFDLIFLDNQMPIMTGVECIQHIRDKGIMVWACGVTGNAMREDQDEFYDAGIDRVLTKPVQEKDVREMIDIVLNLREPDNGVLTWRKKLVRTPTGSSKTDQDSTKQKGSGKVS